jgi:hypothetical protein
MNVKIFTCAHVPESLQQKWLQHLRDFDAANPGCHFEVGVDGPEETVATMIKRLTVEPGLTFTKIFERAKWAPGDEPT